MVRQFRVTLLGGLLALLPRVPVLPVPGGGHLQQPVHAPPGA